MSPRKKKPPRAGRKTVQKQPKPAKPENPISPVVMPDGRDAFGRTRAQQDAHALPVLQGAFFLLCEGWASARDLEELEMRGTPRPENAWALHEALGASSRDDTLIDLEYARRLLRRLEFFFTRWEGHPHRTLEDVLRLVRKAIVLGGGEPPSMPLAPIRERRHQGGWAVSSGPGRVA